MLHIVKQYRKLFMGLMFNKLEGSQHIHDVIKDGDLTLRETKKVNALIGDTNKFEKALASFDYDNIDVKDDAKKRIKEYRKRHKIIVDDFISNVDNIKTETVVQREELKEEVFPDTTDFKIEETIIVEEKNSNKDRFEKTINTDIFTTTLEIGSDEPAQTMALQEFLISKRLLEGTFINSKGKVQNSDDGVFGSRTKAALIKYQESIFGKGHKYADGILTINGQTLDSINKERGVKSSFVEGFDASATDNEVSIEVEKSITKVEALQKLNEDSDKFYKALEAYMDGGERDELLSDMGSILGWGREIIGHNQAEEYFEEYIDKLTDNTVEDKFNEELYELLPKEKNNAPKNVATDLPETTNKNEYTERKKSLSGYLVRDVIIAAVFHDIPLFDIRFNFAKDLIDLGVPMDKALAFKNWIKGGMEGKPNYAQENLDTISGKDTLTTLGKLRATLATAGFSGEEISDDTISKLEKLSEAQQKALLTIIEDRILPDLETLNIGGFNFIERWFDDKDNKIENLLDKLTGKKYLLDIKTENGKDLYLEKVGDNYILEVDNKFQDTYKTFDHYPTKEEINLSIEKYTNLDNDDLDNGWNEPESITISDPDSKIESGKRLHFNLYKLNDFKTVVEKDGKYTIIVVEATEKSIESTYSQYDNWKEIGKGGLNKDISKDEIFSDVGTMLSLLKEQDNEGGIFNTEPNLNESIEYTDDRFEYTKGLDKEFEFVNTVLNILEKKDPELFKKFSMISTFGTVSDFLNAFPSNDLEVRGFLSALKTADSPERYIDILKQINGSKTLNKYFNLVLNAHKDNKTMRAWKEYRINNIEKETGLISINQGDDRKFKYGSNLQGFIDKTENIDELRADILTHLKSETTGEGGDIPSINILGNILKGMINKQGITDITVEDLENAITNTLTVKEISSFDNKTTVVNTAKQTTTRHDTLTSILGLLEKRGDTHVLHAQITKEVTLYKKTGEQVVINKVYDIYLRPECANVLIIPQSVKASEQLVQKDYNMNIASLNTPTAPITLGLVKGAIDGINDLIDNNGNTVGSKTGHGEPIPELPIENTGNPTLSSVK